MENIHIYSAIRWLRLVVATSAAALGHNHQRMQCECFWEFFRCSFPFWRRECGRIRARVTKVLRQEFKIHEFFVSRKILRSSPWRPFFVEVQTIHSPMKRNKSAKQSHWPHFPFRSQLFYMYSCAPSKFPSSKCFGVSVSTSRRC